MTKEQKFLNAALDRMFKAVGFEKYDKSFTENSHCWYTLRTWTIEEECEYKQWFTTEYLKKFKGSKKYAASEASWFLLSYGWKVDYGDL